MRSFLYLLLSVLIAVPQPAHAAAGPATWTTQIPPFRIADNLYYVGSEDLASYLITTPAGNILINSSLPSSPPLIRRSVEQLGFHWTDTRILLVSHAHFDHAGGSAQVLRETGAKYEVMQGDEGVVESGGRTDFAYGPKPQYPPAHVDHVLHDGDTVSLGGVTLTAHLTAGHTHGCTTWTLRTHVPGDPAATLRDVVIVGSWNVNPGYRLVASPGGKPASYPGIAGDYNRTFFLLHELPCDVFLGAHGSYFNMLEKLKRMPAEGDKVWIDPAGYERAVAEREQAFDAEYGKQRDAAKRRSLRK